MYFIKVKKIINQNEGCMKVNEENYDHLNLHLIKMVILLQVMHHKYQMVQQHVLLLLKML